MMASRPARLVRRNRAGAVASSRTQNPHRLLDRDDVGPWGDVFTRKKKNTLRVVFQNTGGFPLKRKPEKQDLFKRFAQENNVDVIGLAETNVCWKNLPINERIYDQTKEWWERRHISYNYNKDENTNDVYQPGGTAVITRNKAATYVQGSAGDPLGLGRWSSTVLEGQGGVCIRIIAAYKPVKSSGPSSTYQQQQNYFDNNGIQTEP